MKNFKRAIALILIVISVFSLCSCGKENNTVVIYTSSDENELAVARELLDQKFPDVDIRLEYYSTGDQAAKLKAEGTKTECDIAYDLEIGYMQILDAQNEFAKLDGIDQSIFVDDLIVSDTIVPTMRYGGAIIVNTEVLAAKGLDKPTCYEDLLKPEYKDLIIMPNPSASGTGYMFYKSLVNAWGQDEALAYFDALSENIIQFTSSGSGPVNALVSGEAAVGLGMTSHAALNITEGNPLEILFFEEGSPYLACGAAIISGKESRQLVKDVFAYIYEVVTPAICEQLYPEQIYKNKTFTMENYPENIPYADMSDNTPEVKEAILAVWNH